MNQALRTSPLHFLLEKFNPQWKVLNGMPVAWHISSHGNEPVLMSSTALCDVSCLPRFGLKGPAAEEWFVQQGIEVPARPNTWVARDDGGLIARLGEHEFLLEDGLNGETIQQIKRNAVSLQDDSYIVPRQDAALALHGLRGKEILNQVCSLPLEKVCTDRRVVMTLLAGVGVTVIRVDQDAQPGYRIWCDGTYGSYLWNTLLQLIEEVGGQAVGLADFYPSAGLS